VRVLATLVLLVLVTACGATSTEEAPASSRSTDITFVTELMHRDAALLNLLDVALGRRLDPELTTATDQLRVEANARIETSADQLESWGEKVPKTVRDHSFEHSSDGHSIPSLDGAPTGDDLQKLDGLPPAGFEAAFTKLLVESLETTRELAGRAAADAESVARLAEDATRSCDIALDML
jgi:uncharacterized protein (DUF305 family)